jgi:hypothetical protein
MKLSHIMTSKPGAKRINKVLESRFGFSIDYDALTLPKAEQMRTKIQEAVTSIRKSSAIHTAEKNPQYLEMLIVYEGLSRFIDATIIQENQQRRRKLKEGELGQAEAMLAAKDMVDTVQGMIEKVGKMQNEQLPALVDAIRDQIGSPEADQFKVSVSQLLMTLSQQLGVGRDQLDSSTRALTGEEIGGVGAEPEQMGDMGDQGPEEGDGLDGSNAAAGGTEPMGRGMR